MKGESMGMAEEMARLAREVIATYEARVASVEQIIEATQEMLETFRSQWETMRTQLRETLARAASLRRRDFDAMIQGILARQEERERAVKETMRAYLAEQRGLAAELRGALAGGEAERIGAVTGLLDSIAARREAREREVRAILTDFQREQEELTGTLEGLLSNGSSVRVRDLKAALKTIQSRCWSRIELASPRQLGREESLNGGALLGERGADGLLPDG